MNREEYLKALKTNIMSLSLDEQNEALQYYSDYFDEAGDDQKVIAELGSPEELAKVIIEKFANALVAKESEKSSEDSEKVNVNSDFSDALYYEYDKAQVRDLVLNIGAAEIVMVSGDVYSVETRGISEEFMNCHLGSDGVLVINNTKKLNLNFWSHERRKRIVPRILITVPEDAALGKLKLTVGAGDFKAKNLNVTFNEGCLDVGAGNLILNGLKGGRMNLRCGMGNLDYTGILSGKINIDCGMGNVRLKLSGNPSEYSYDAKIGLGDFRYNEEKKSGVCKVLDNARKENHFSVNCGMGSVNITVK